jgi:hypothetical protein
MDAAAQRDVEGAIAAARTLGALTGHLPEPGAVGGGNVLNVTLAQMVQRLDQEERDALPPGEQPKLIEGAPARGDPAF